VSVEEAIEHDQKRQTALDLARIFATARESGVEPKFSGLVNTVRNAATPEGAYKNTEFYYAFELVALLRRISEHTFLLDAPPILGQAPAETVEALGQATRCFLLGLTRPCMALCRLALQTILESRVSRDEVLQEVTRTKKTGELVALINVAARKGILRPDLNKAAHEIRKKGNDAVHGPAPKEEEVWPLLIRMRQIVRFRQVCIAAARAGINDRRRLRPN
jgi:hypothetical protein